MSDLRKRMAKKGNITERAEPDERRGSYDDVTFDMFLNQEEAIETAQSEPGGLMTAVQSKEIRTGGFLWTSTGLEVIDDITSDDIEFTGEMLKMVDSSLQWLIGDWLLQADKIQYGGIKDFSEKIGFEVDTIYEYKSVAKSVEIWVRTQDLTYGHHKLVRAFDSEKQQEWLDKAVKNDWSISDLREAIKGKKKTPKVLTASDYLNKAFKRVSKLTESLIENGAKKDEIILILQQQIDELKKPD